MKESNYIALNRLSTLHNVYQNRHKYRRILCVCSAGCLRSPTAAWVLSNLPHNANTRAVGVDREFAIIPITKELVEWADEIVVMEDLHRFQIESQFGEFSKKPIYVLDIPDCYEYRDPKLIELINTAYMKRKLEETA